MALLFIYLLYFGPDSFLPQLHNGSGPLQMEPFVALFVFLPVLESPRSK